MGLWRRRKKEGEEDTPRHQLQRLMGDLYVAGREVRAKQSAVSALLDVNDEYGGTARARFDLETGERHCAGAAERADSGIVENLFYNTAIGRWGSDEFQIRVPPSERFESPQSLKELQSDLLDLTTAASKVVKHTDFEDDDLRGRVAEITEFLLRVEDHLPGFSDWQSNEVACWLAGFEGEELPVYARLIPSYRRASITRATEHYALCWERGRTATAEGAWTAPFVRGLHSRSDADLARQLLPTIPGDALDGLRAAATELERRRRTFEIALGEDDAYFEAMIEETRGAISNVEAERSELDGIHGIIDEENERLLSRAHRAELEASASSFGRVLFGDGKLSLGTNDERLEIEA